MLTGNTQTQTDTDEQHIHQSMAVLKQNYVADNRPWIVAYSGGKDSTLMLQLAYELQLSIAEQERKPIHIVASDTRVEAPIIEDYVGNNLMNLEKHASSLNLNIYIHLVQPEIEHSFWTNIIGKGYPPPNRWFRWCTSKLKIKPVRRVIEKIASKHGSVVLLLGTRYAESSNRSRQMNSREYSSRQLNPHHEIPNTLVLQPIAYWSTEQVWEYLYTNNPPPWGVCHDEMLKLYRQANSGECPVVTDLNTPPCGGSRFGCWTCTVVREDKSMKGFIDAGEEWMQPLYEFRQKLKDWREDDSNRNKIKRNGKQGLGPFTSVARELILKELLMVEKTLGRQLISDEELVYIQSIWSDEFDVKHTALKMAHGFQRNPMAGDGS